ncbi:flagellar basal-body MS-ring/collar protein FliF [Allosphingosinicella sp.]|jgi:flagellar M-ring protein FliF|uniref:flagellar basal-body MS-ring/collar protein FliF n=1 Tax=Allosphingosinicella sp. TaxID=2823234 RepID=UPI002F1EF569
MLDTFRSAAPGRQLLAIGAALLVIATVLAVAYLLWFRTSFEMLFSDLPESEAAAVVAELDRLQIPYELKDGGRSILVPSGAVDSTRLSVAGQDLALKGAAGFELFNTSGMALTEFSQRINLQRALQGEIARTIATIDGVESARIHLTLAEPTVFRGDRRPARAAVTVAMRPGRRLAEPAVRGIQRLVAGSVPDLELGNVVVLNEQGAIVSADTAPDSPVPAGMEEKRRTEQFYEARLRRQLETRYPRHGFDVIVWAGEGSANAAQGAAGPGDRHYPLRVTIAVAGSLPVDLEHEIGAVAASAIALDATRGDSVSVSTSVARPSTPPELGAAWEKSGHEAGSGVSATPRETRALSLSGMWTPLAILLVCLALFMLGRRRSRAMSEEQRLLYVRKVRAALEQRDADAVPAA